MPAGQGRGIEDREVEHELTRPGPALRFSRPLETRFEAETGPARSRMLFMQGIIGISVFLGYLLVDLQLTPDVFGLAVIIRCGVVAPIALIGLVTMWFNPPPALRETIPSAIGTLALLSTLLLMLLSQSDLRDGHASSTILAMLFIAVVQRARFPYSAAACLLLFIAQVAALSLLAGYPQERLISSAFTLGGATALILMACYMLERESRRAYLLQLRERLANSALVDISLRDPLTGIGNRRALDAALAELAASTHEGENVAVILIDVDHFKAYNDAVGHLAGDAALKRVADLMLSVPRRPDDRAFRFGGEEFLLLLPRTDLGESVALAERLRRAVEAEAIPHPTSPMRILTLSLGAASARLGGPVSAEELIAAADTALYAAKRSGRNQVWPPLLATRAEQVLRMRRPDAS